MNFEQIIKEIIYLTFVPPNLLLFLRILFIIVSLFFILAIIYFIKKSSWLNFRYTADLKDFFEFKPHEIKKFEKAWKQITARLQIASEDEYKLALIEADNLLNNILKRMGYRGRTLEERLKQVNTGVLPELSNIMIAHKFSTNIINDPSCRVTREQAERFIKFYEKSFQDLHIL